MSVSILLGGIGLFLLGMWLLTEGLKLAGGKALQHMLGTWTSSKRRGLAAGILVTALAQSSSAVTVAAIGFVNAQLMTFTQSIWVVFGSNLGSTFTTWLVTLFGLKFSISALTFPLIGIGAFLRVFAPYERARALGMALAGFGILFMGIDNLRDGFTGVAQSGWLLQLLAGDHFPIFWGFLIGLVLTVLTQASVAAIAIILTAVASGIAGIEVAAAGVIGANVGTTSTALMASIGATSNAKRLAWAHVLFNVITAAVALMILPVLLWMGTITGIVSVEPDALVTLLAIFHTFFNLLGVAIMWPLEPHVSRFLLNRFRAPREEHQAEFLDTNVASVPDLAVRALSAQLHHLASDIAAQRLEAIVRQGKVAFSATAKNRMMAEIEAYIETVSQASLSPALASQLTAGLAIKYYLHHGLQLLEHVQNTYGEGALTNAWLRDEVCDWLAALSDYNGDLYQMHQSLAEERWQALVDTYPALKNRLMDAGTLRRAPITEIDAALQLASLGRRFSEQLRHTLDRFVVLDALDTPRNLDGDAGDEEPDDAAGPGEEGYDGELLPDAR